jgi:hypothetical protein
MKWTFGSGAMKNPDTKDLGWIQCSQCGWGCEIHKSEVDAGDYVDRQACPDCGLGPCRIDWDYPWVAEEK